MPREQLRRRRRLPVATQATDRIVPATERPAVHAQTIQVAVRGRWQHAAGQRAQRKEAAALRARSYQRPKERVRRRRRRCAAAPALGQQRLQVGVAALRGIHVAQLGDEEVQRAGARGLQGARADRGDRGAEDAEGAPRGGHVLCSVLHLGVARIHLTLQAH